MKTLNENDIQNVFEIKNLLSFETYFTLINGNTDDEQKYEQAKREFVRKQSQLLVTDGAQFMCGTHKGTFHTNYKWQTINNKGVARQNDVLPENFTFEDGFQIISIESWQRIASTTTFNDEYPLLFRSTIKITGKMPGNNPPESYNLQFLTAGQNFTYEDTIDVAYERSVLGEEDQTIGVVFDFYFTDKDNNRVEKITYGDDVFFHLHTTDLVGETITLMIDSPNVSYECNGNIVIKDTFKDYTIKEEEEIIPLKAVLTEKQIGKAVSKFTITVASISYEATIELKVWKKRPKWAEVYAGYPKTDDGTNDIPSKKVFAEVFGENDYYFPNEECIYTELKKGGVKIDMKNACATRVSLGLINAKVKIKTEFRILNPKNPNKDKGIIVNAKLLKNFLTEEWGEADVIISKRPKTLNEVAGEINAGGERNGVYIILGGFRPPINGHATLWIGAKGDAIGKHSYVNAGTVYFWELE